MNYLRILLIASLFLLGAPGASAAAVCNSANNFQCTQAGYMCSVGSQSAEQTGYCVPITPHAGQACGGIGDTQCPTGTTCRTGPRSSTQVCVTNTTATPSPSVDGGEDSTGGGVDGAVLKNPLAGGNINSLNDLLAALLNVLVQIGVVVLTLMIVYCGFLFVTAQGNPENLSKAKSALLWTVIGGAIVLGAGVISEAIKSTVGAL